MRASFAFIIVLVCSTAFAQNVRTIAGTVKDPQGLAIPGATIVLANRVSQASQNAVSDEQGRFTLNNVAYGTYVSKCRSERASWSSEVWILLAWSVVLLLLVAYLIGEGR